jgi:hypothetical protein
MFILGSVSILTPLRSLWSGVSMATILSPS